MQQQAFEKLMQEIHQIILAGLRHGFFEFQIEAEVIKDKTRCVTVNAGKKYRFYVPEDELK